MQIKIPHFGYVLTDRLDLPRYWTAAWTLLVGGPLAASTLKQRQLNIEAFYRHAEDGRAFGLLDDALGSQDLPLLEELLESYFVTLRNIPEVTSGTEQRWHDAVEFVRAISERLTRTPDMSARLIDVTLRLERLDRLYGQLRVGKPRSKHFVRALPAAVLSELLEMVQLGSQCNPFKSDTTQWRVYCTFLLLFNAGLRRGSVAKMIQAGRANGPIVKEFRRIQTEDCDDAAYTFLKAEADGFHAIPYGHCLNSFTADPCPTHLECFNGCMHLSATDLPENRRNLIVLEGKLKDALALKSASPTLPDYWIGCSAR